MSNSYLFINDHFVPEATGSLAVNDLSMQRGYALFDYLKTMEGVPLYLDDHLDRLFFSAKEMHLPISYSREAIKDILNQLIQRNNIPQSGIRITLTGGYSPDSYTIGTPNLIISQSALTLPSNESFYKGIRLMSYPHQRQLPHIKTTDYVMAIWLQPLMKKQGADDILYYQEEAVRECPRANVFMVKDKKLMTPSQHILKGVIRKQVLQLASKVLPVEEGAFSVDELKDADEVFITSTTKQVLPVQRIDDVELYTDKPGPITSALRDLLIQQQKAQLKTEAAV